MRLVFGCLLIGLCLITGCAQVENKSLNKESIKDMGQPEGNESALFHRVVDDTKREVDIMEQPQRILTLTPTFLDMIYALGGEAVGRPYIPDEFTMQNLPESAKALPSVGAIGNPNLETMMSLEPDLVVGTPRAHDRFIEPLQSAGIPLLILRMNSYDDVKHNIELFGKLLNKEEQAEAAIAAMELQIDGLIARLPEASPKVAIVHINSEEVLLETSQSLAGHIAQMLKIDQIGAGDANMEGRPDKTYFSIEKLVELDPDMILFTIRGEKQDVEPRMKADIEQNPAWNTLRAVKEEQVVFLPQEYFMINAGVKYGDAVEYMAKIVYPEVFGHVE